MATQRELERDAARLARLLRASGLKVVFAESCTGGLVSAILAGIPGISANLCGSAVVYRPATKTAWLGVPEALLESPGPVSRPVADAMAASALARTPEAELAVSVTGHLGPDAPQRQDGLVYIGVALRGNGTPAAAIVVSVKRHRLADPPGAGRPGGRLAIRRRRQRAAARLVLGATVRALERRRQSE